MKFFQQHGGQLRQTSLHESDQVCECCQDFAHAAQKWHHDDVECKKCGQLCRCDCHRHP